MALTLEWLLTGGCYYRLEGDFDPHRCDPACSAGKICHQGRCVFIDSGAADGPQADTNPDTPVPDAGQPDAPVTDNGQPDGLPDGPTPDAVQPDQGSPDGPPPDTGVVVPGAWVTIPPAGTTLPVTFSMGSPTGEPCQDSDEDQHPVTLTHEFEITAHEVTQGVFQAVMGYNPSYFSSCGSSCPVEYVNWHEAAAYCNALSTKAGLASCYSCSGTGTSVSCGEASSYSAANVYDCPGYRLPTEAEWEYAYRAGTTTAYYNGTNDSSNCYTCSSVDTGADTIGWYCANSGSTPHPVGQKAANAWGLRDMAGNVWEWCHDWYQVSLGSSAATDPWGAVLGSGRVLRGGSWYFGATHLRAAARRDLSPTNRPYDVGFRCARTR